MPFASISKGNLNLRYASRSGRNAGQLEAAERLVVSRHLAFALQYVDVDAGLTVGRGGEYLRLLDRDGGVAVDQAGEYAAEGFNAEGQRGNVEQDNILHVAAQHAALNRRADRDAFVRVDCPCRAPCRSRAEPLPEPRGYG